MINNKKVNLFVVGMPKTGTTSLYRYFKKHSEIFVPKNKEPNYFAQEVFSDRFRKESLKEYFSLELKGYQEYYSKSNDKRYLADLTPTYIYSIHAARKIKDYNPQAKIIALFREPVSFLYSLHAELVFSLMEDRKDFLSALHYSRKHSLSSLSNYSHWIKYSEHLNRYLKHFSKENIKVIIYEKFSEDNAKTLCEISKFLDINNFDEDYTYKVNTYKKNRLKFIKSFVWSFPSVIKFIKKRLPNSVFNLLTNFYLTLTTKRAKKKPLDEMKLITLKRTYKKDVIKFEKLLKEYDLIDKDFDLLKFWGYDKL